MWTLQGCEAEGQGLCGVGWLAMEAGQVESGVGLRGSDFTGKNGTISRVWWFKVCWLCKAHSLQVRAVAAGISGFEMKPSFMVDENPVVNPGGCTMIRTVERSYPFCVSL